MKVMRTRITIWLRLRCYRVVHARSENIHTNKVRYTADWFLNAQEA